MALLSIVKWKFTYFQCSLSTHAFIVFFIIKCSTNGQALSTLQKCHFGLSVDTQMNRRRKKNGSKPIPWTYGAVFHSLGREKGQWTSTSVSLGLSLKMEASYQRILRQGGNVYPVTYHCPGLLEAYQGASLFTQWWPIRAKDWLSRPSRPSSLLTVLNETL